VSVFCSRASLLMSLSSMLHCLRMAPQRKPTTRVALEVGARCGVFSAAAAIGYSPAVAPMPGQGSEAEKHRSWWIGRGQLAPGCATGHLPAALGADPGQQASMDARRPSSTSSALTYFLFGRRR
jgi:hypothetical protein